MQTYLRRTISIFALLMALDVATTNIILNLGGTELNPLAQVWIDQAGVLGLILQKLVALGLIVGAIILGLRYAERHGMGHKAMRAYTVALMPLASFPVLWNLALIGEML